MRVVKARASWVPSGGALASVGLGLLAWNLTEPGANLFLWLSAFALLGGFLIWERLCPAPMIRLGLFRNPLFALTNLVTLTLYFALSGVMFADGVQHFSRSCDQTARGVTNSCGNTRGEACPVCNS